MANERSQHPDKQYSPRAYALPKSMPTPATPFSKPATPFSKSARSAAYTLVELVVVIAIIGILVTIAIPSVNGIVTDASRASAENTIKGLLKSAKARARNNVETGLFLFIEDGAQKVAFIQASPANLTADVGLINPDVDFNASGTPIAEFDAADRFEIVGELLYTIPRPYRLAPLAILDLPVTDSYQSGTVDPKWTSKEISNEIYDDFALFSDNTTGGNTQGPENHRNFFTIIFGPDGRIVSDRSVFISDIPDADDIININGPNGAAATGKVTRLNVNNCTDYQDIKGDTHKFSDLGAGHPGLPHIVSIIGNGTRYALNFVSVDGLIIYNNDAFLDAPDEIDRRREFLAETSQPYYISPRSGQIIAGPVGTELEP